MELPTVTTAVFEDLPRSAGTSWALRVSIVAEELVQRAAPVIARVGEVDVERIVVVPGGGLIGFLAERPADGARLRIGYADTGLQDTPVTYEAPPVA